MKPWLTVLLLLFICGCSKSSDDGSAGTRGGGDVCEIDYRAQLGEAYIWLRDSGRGMMDVGELLRLEELNPAMLKAVDVHCTDGPLKIDGYRKTAITTSGPGGRFSTQVDSVAWFGAKRKARTALAVHEILVMLGIEKTDDYHVSFLVPDSSEYIWAQSVTCERTFRHGHAVVFDLHYTPSDPTQLTYTAVLTFTGEAPIDLATDLDCYFTNADQLLFTCYTGGKQAVEIVQTNNGPEIRIDWARLPAPSMKLAEVQKLVNELSPFPRSGDLGPQVTIPMGWETLGIDAPAEYGRCRVIEQD